MQHLNTGKGGNIRLVLWLVTLLLHANSFVCVLGVRSQTLGGKQRSTKKNKNQPALL